MMCFFNDTATTEIYTLSLHDALPILLMDHPAVQQVVTFAMAHDKLGEEVAAAVVLREGASADERDIRSFAAGRLADFKVPRSEEHTSELQSRQYLVCRLLLEKKHTHT